MSEYSDTVIEALSTECADFINLAGNQVPKDPDHDACPVERQPAPGAPAWRCTCPCHDPLPEGERS